VLVRSPDGDRLAGLLRGDGIDVETTGPETLTVTGLTTAEVGRRAYAAGVELHELRARTSGLEEVYFQLTAGQEQYAAAPAGGAASAGASVPGSDQGVA
jgi:ABC-2 type transport system ATP-binding protein